MILPKTGLSTSQAYTWTAQQTFTAVPTGMAFGDATVVVNPATADPNNVLQVWGVAGTSKVEIDEDGDFRALGHIMAGSATGGGTQMRMRSNAGNYANFDTSNTLGFSFTGTAVGRGRILVGEGCRSQLTLDANLDQTDFHLWRNVDGTVADTFDIAGDVFRITVDTSNPGTETWNYVAMGPTGSTVFWVDKDGEINSTSGLGIDGLAYIGVGLRLAHTVVESAYYTTYKSAGIFIERGTNFDIHITTPPGDDAIKTLSLTGQAPRASATTNKVGGNITVTGGVGDGAGGQEEADGGNVVITGGAAASDLNLSDGGHVLIGGGANGTTGDDGAVKLGDGDTETNFVQIATDGTMTFEGTARKTKHIIITNADLGKGASAASQVIVGHYVVWEFGINDDAVVTWEVPPDYAAGTDIDISLHWQIDEAYALNNGEVQWQVEWAATPHDETEAIDNPTHTGTLDAGDQNIPATAKFLTATDVGTISGANLSAEDSLGLAITRIALDTGAPGANPAAEPGILHLEIQYLCGKIGE